MLESHEAVNACGGRVRGAGGREGDDGGEGGERCWVIGKTIM